MPRYRPVTWNGATYPTVAEACAAAGISRVLFDWRCSQGMSVSEALSKPVNEKLRATMLRAWERKQASPKNAARTRPQRPAPIDGRIALLESRIAEALQELRVLKAHVANEREVSP